MKKGHRLLYVMAVGLVAMGHSQSAPAQQAAFSATSQNSSATAPAAAPSGAPGNDAVHLVTGQVLEHVKVLRATGPQIQILVWGGVAPLQIAKKLVEHIEYGPNDTEAGEEEEAKTPEIITGAELSTEFHAKLTTPLSEAPITFEDSDFVAALEILGEEAEIQIVIEAAVRSLPQETRRWQVEIPPESSFDIILQEYLLPAFPKLAVRYEFDQIRLTLAG